VFGLGDYDSTATVPGGSCTNRVFVLGSKSGDCRDDGFTTRSAWGYRARARLEYPNLIGGFNITPTFAWSHDVNGYSPEPGQQFHEGRKSVGVSILAEYQSKYTINLSYTNFFGGSHNTLTDKDFISVSFGLSL
jgi:hypothetical protein